MYSNLSIALVGLALAAIAQAKPDHKHVHHHHLPSGVFPTGLPYKPSGTAPFPSIGIFPSGASSGIFPSGTAAGTGSLAQASGDTTLTYTVGQGDHKTVITTTIHHTQTHTDYVYGSQTAAPGEGAGGNSPAQGSDEGNSNGGSVTQTLFLTSTSTNYITAYASQSSEPSQPAVAEKVADNNSAANGASGNGGCVAPVTVTVSSEITVTVTASAAAAPTNGGTDNNNSLAGQSQGAASSLPPFPIPSSKKHKSKCASTGFLTKSVKPTGTGGVAPTGSGGVKRPFPLAGEKSTAPIVSAKAYKN